ncbi:hypothetical protein PR202_ga04605 [Eleusine coracana subsp. coracana]|uniref:Peptidase A1 domain-containing protein n=1 Tax=Eleusine coracana subsp. coracana TaxID=191504 RepID=A0AAV5BQ17_ELECO|nr:hypothetical protein QOZ80_5AG0373790 [Eleusine coracana subsp. coracana]GJM88531.1 hypothetical protein PR202_ga04605 [Eleusine coracana subsp. coracana]
MARTMASLAVSIALLLCLLSPTCRAATRSGGNKPPRAVMLPVRKDAATGQYVTTFRQRTPLVPVTAVLDLASPTVWVDCEKRYASSTYRGLPCESKLCRLTGSGSCATACYGKPGPSCLNNTCSGLPQNTATSVSTSGNIITDVLALPTTPRQGPLATAPAFLFTCGATFLTKGLAAGATGMASLSRNRFALPAQLANTFRLPRTKFALCLPSTPSSAAPSVGAVIGDAPHVFQPGVDLSGSLAYTPLLVNPVSGLTHFQGDKSDEYFIGVSGVKVNGRAVPLNATLLAVNKKTGNGGAKLSTAAPYTVLETSIYRAVTAAFAAATAGIPRAPAVAPFKLCYDGSKVGSTRVGPAVPNIELVLGNSKGAPSWVVFGANSMVAARGGALCLAVVDGGKAPTTSVVIGGHMLEDNLLEFDLDRSRLGFSSSLLFRQTNCNNFHISGSQL